MFSICYKVTFIACITLRYFYQMIKCKFLVFVSNGHSIYSNGISISKLSYIYTTDRLKSNEVINLWVIWLTREDGEWLSSFITLIYLLVDSLLVSIR